MVDFQYNELIYKELRFTIANFRNQVMMKSMNAIPGTVISGNDVQNFAIEIQRPEYKNVISEIMIQERKLYNLGMKSVGSIDKVLAKLNRFVEQQEK